MLPGKGWYSRILAVYLGPHAALYGVNYSDNTWYLFDRDEEWIEKRIALTDKYIERVHGYVDNAVAVSDVEMGSVSKETATAVDRTRAAAPGLLDEVDTDIEVRSFTFNTVPVEVAGTVDRVLFIRAFEQAGFALVVESEINANPKDKPGPSDVVWRLPPRLLTSMDDPELRAAMEAVGESDRMTLLFRMQP